MPTLTLPERFRNDPYFGDYHKILGLNPGSPLTKEEVVSAARAAALLYHPDKINSSPVQPKLTIEEATACFQAINEIKSIFLLQCPDVTSEASAADENVSSSSSKKAAPVDKTTVNSADDLSYGEQLKAVMVGYIRSERFCEYAEGTGPAARGYWCFIMGGDNGIEIGRSRFSGNIAIATRHFQVELGQWDEPVIVYDKTRRPFTTISDPQRINEVLQSLAMCIPKERRDHNAKTYGEHVREPRALSEEKKHAELPENTQSLLSVAPYMIEDLRGNNFVDGVRQNADHSFTIYGRNCNGDPREITLFEDGHVSGYNRSPDLGIVGNQFFENREAIFEHFGLHLSEELPNQMPPRFGF